MRVFAAFGVIIIHVSARWHEALKTDVYSLEWNALNFLRGAVMSWAVSIFVMISGALFLSKDIPLRKIYSKYIFRIFTAFLFWSFVYACAYYVVKGDAVKSLENFVKGHFHMWFLFMITGLYMIVPFLKRIAQSESQTKYFLALAFFFSFLLPDAVKLILIFSEHCGEIAGDLLSAFNLNFAGLFSGYFLLGYFLNSQEFSHKTERLIYSAGISGLIIGMLLSFIFAVKAVDSEKQIAEATCYMCYTISVFIFFKSKFNRPSRIIRVLSQYSFGAYLVHDAVIQSIEAALEICGYNFISFSPVISVPLISVIVFVISFAISAVLNQIPVVNKYIV